MPNINVTLSIQVEGGPQVAVAPVKVPVEAYDKIEVSVNPGTTDLNVAVQPGDKAVSFLLIKSSIYTPPDAGDNKKLTFKPEGKSAINLDNPQIYLGTESITALLGDVKKIAFSNKLEGAAAKEPAVIEILVGRDATPPPTSTPTPTPTP